MNKSLADTEKNLGRMPKRTALSKVILFLDEADALLGQRSEVREAYDRQNNLGIDYLLRQIEDYTGVAIPTTNL